MLQTLNFLAASKGPRTFDHCAHDVGGGDRREDDDDQPEGLGADAVPAPAVKFPPVKTRHDAKLRQDVLVLV